VHNSITEYEQNVSLTLKCETVANQIHGLISTISNKINKALKLRHLNLFYF
jgi:hypothetical protein